MCLACELAIRDYSDYSAVWQLSIAKFQEFHYEQYLMRVDSKLDRFIDCFR